MKSKLYFGVILLPLCFSVFENTNAQSASPPWDWAKVINGARFSDLGPSIALDPSGSGDVYTTGNFFGTVDFDPGVGTFSIPSTGIYSDMFISKLDGAGNFVWAKAMSAALGSSYGYSITIDPGSGDIYTTGSFYGVVDFDPGPGTFYLIYAGQGGNYSDIFISKLDSSGNFVWAKRMGGTVGGTDDDWGRSIAVDPAGNGDVYITGSFSETVDFDPGIDTFNLTSAGGYDIFISKLDSSGNFVWAKSMGGSKDDIGFSIAIDPAGSGDVYITGDFSGQADFDPDTDNIFNLYSTADFDTFISKLDSSGNFLWARAMFGENSDGSAGYSIIVDPEGSGEIYTTGYFAGTVDFDPDKGIFELTSTGDDDIFISKLNRTGDFIWAKAMGGTTFDAGRSIAVAGNGDVYIIGSFSGTADIDPDAAGTFNLMSAGSHDIFISKLDGSGNFLWAKAIGGTQLDYGCSIAIDTSGSGNVYVAGYFSSPSISFDSTTLTNAGNTGFGPDMFVAKLDFVTSIDLIDSKTHQITIYPNPAKDELMIDLGELENETMKVTLYNTLGGIVYAKTDQNILQKLTIDISSLPTGIYFIELNIDGNRIMKKVVKE